MHERLADELRRWFGSAEGLLPEVAGFVAAVDAVYRERDALRRRVAYGEPPASAEPVERFAALEAEMAERAAAEEAARRSEARLRMVLEQTPALLWTLDEGLRITLSMGRPIEALDLQAGDLVGMHLFDVIGDEDPESPAVQAHLRALEGAPTRYEHEWRGRRFRVRVEPLVNPAGEVSGVVGVALDVTESARAEEALRESEIRFRSVVETLGEGLLITDAEDRVLYANPRVEEIYGYRPEELVGRMAFEFLVPGDEREIFFERLQRRLEGHAERYELRSLRKDGTETWTEIHATPYRDAAGRVVGTVGAITEITERKLVEEQLAHGALHDALTGLPNRALFINRLEHALERLRRGRGVAFAVLFLDLDRFKLINDSLGHTTGDELLREVGGRLEATIRPGDTVSRFGGDEFTILLDNVGNAVDATHVADRVLHALAAPFTVRGRVVYTSASIGLALCASGDARPEELLRNADAALHRAKGHGKGRYEVFDREMHAAAMLRLQMETDLRRALHGEEIRIAYQPVIRLRTGRIVGFEALARWLHPTHGLVDPTEFIPIAEETGLIVPLGRWVLGEACRTLSGWQARHPRERPLTVGVNVSPRQFLQGDLPGDVAHATSEHPLAPGSLLLEITESVLIDEADAVRETVDAVRALGSRFCLDDFGTGYASLGYLQRLPIETLKIDREFVHGMEHELEKARFVAAIIALAKNLGLQVVAEGVDSAAQLELLREMACDFAQGFLMAEALAPDEAEQMLADDPRW